MLTFRNTTIFCIVLLVALIGYHWQHDLPFFIYPVVLLIWSLLLFWGSYYVGSQFYIKTICAAVTRQKVIAISFDDGPLPDYTPQVLQVLQIRVYYQPPSRSTGIRIILPSIPNPCFTFP